MPRPRKPKKTDPASPPTTTAPSPAAPVAPPPPDHHPQTHSFAYGASGEVMVCPCGAECQLVLRDKKAVRVYRAGADAAWGEAIGVCSKYVPPAPPPPVPVAPDPHSTDAPGDAFGGLLAALREQHPEAFAPEMIGRSDVDEAANDVMLDVAYSPVLPHRLPADPLSSVGDALLPVEATALGEDKYRVYLPEGPRDVDAATLRVMRARYLLTRGELARALYSMGPQAREKWARLYHITWLPPAGSPLATMIQSGQSGPISIPRDGDKPIDVAALTRVLSTPGAAIPAVCPTLPDPPAEGAPAAP